MLGWSLLAGILVLAAPQGSLDAGSTPVVVGKGSYDFDRDGMDDELLVTFVSGRRGPDPFEWCGGYDKYQGRFLLVVELTSGESARQSLNRFWPDRGDELFLEATEKPLEIAFADYNGDGQVDFYMDLYAACLWRSYKIFTVSSLGAVSELPLGPDRTQLDLPFGCSTDCLQPSDYGFTYQFFEMQNQVRVHGRCEWHTSLGRFECREETSEESVPEDDTN
jgi:hypothetical protein